jgi:hypothetical protein
VTVHSLWIEAPYPADPGYLLDLLDGIETGRIDPSRPPWCLDDADPERRAACVQAWIVS